MAMFSPVPALYKWDRELRKFKVANDGSVRAIFMPKLDVKARMSKYDKERKQMMLLKPQHLGSLISATNLAEVSVQITSEKTILSVGNDASDPERVAFVMKDRKSNEEVQVTGTLGDFKALQTLLESILPALYGWQVFTNPAAITQLLEEPYNMNIGGPYSRSPPSSPSGGGAARPDGPPPSADDFFREGK